MKKLVLAIAIGSYHVEMAKITHPLLDRYARRVGADFRVITGQKVSLTTPHWEKFQVYQFLEEYDRIIFFDTDLIVRGDTPDLFALVPEGSFGAFNEAPYTGRSSGILETTARAYDIDISKWDGRYFNTGVLVVSKNHRNIFLKPELEIDHFYEQTYLNSAFLREKAQIFELDYRFNRMACMDRFANDHRLDAYVVHYAGVEDPDPRRVYDFIESEIAQWKSRGFL